MTHPCASALALALAVAGCGSDSSSDGGDGPIDLTTAPQPDLLPGNAATGGELLVNQGGPSSTIQARFVTATACTRRTLGPCTLVECPAGASSKEVDASAGTLAVSGANVPANVTLDPTLAGNYPPYYRPTALFLQGDVIAVTAAGATVPAFTQMATAPSAIAVLAPACDAQGCGVIDPAKDLAVSWNGGTDTVEIRFVVTVLAGATAELTCRFPATDKKGTVPAATLALLPRSDGATALGRLRLSSVAVKRFTAGPLDTELLLQHQVADSTYSSQ